GLHAEAAPDGVGHQPDRFDARAAAGVEPRGGLHEVGAGVLGRPAGGDDAVVVEPRRLDDHLEDHLDGGGTDGRQVGGDVGPVAVGGPPQVDDDVDLGGALLDGTGGLGRLDLCVVGARGEAADDGQCDPG